MNSLWDPLGVTSQSHLTTSAVYPCFGFNSPSVIGRTNRPAVSPYNGEAVPVGGFKEVGNNRKA